MHTQEDDEGEYKDEVISSEDVASYLSVNNIGRRVTMVNGQHNLPNGWLLLDSCSTANLIMNRALLHDIHTVDTSISIQCNAGTNTTNQKGYLGDYPTPVWYNPKGIANILSMKDVAQHYRLTMDTNEDEEIRLHHQGKSPILFIPSGKGLYKFDTKGQSPNILSMITTTKATASQYTRREYEKAIQARKLQTI